MKSTTLLFIIALLFFFKAPLHAQQNTFRDFHDSVIFFDFSRLWCTDSLPDLEVLDGMLTHDPEKSPFPEPLGFIGKNDQRFYIHFISVTRNDKDHFQYFVKGKTKVNDNICVFTGTIKIDSAWLYHEYHVDGNIFRQGHLICSCRLYEEKGKYASGVISGHLKTDFCLFKNRLYYDNIHIVSDGYCNNQFTGRWKNYNSSASMKCNWGDYRIADSKDFDIGAGDFSVAKEYIKYGWENYCKAYGCSESDSITRQKAIKLEDKEWWK